MIFEDAISATPDLGITIFSGAHLFWLICALAGGFFGAAIGANYAFAFTGVLILLGLGVVAATGDTIILDYVAFGPVFGPHVSFAGGAAAAAYAARKGYLSSGGKDINTPLQGLVHYDTLFIGALFGGAGYVVERAVRLIPWFGTHTDTVAFTVVLSALVARAAFGRTPIFTRTWKLDETHRWLDFQEKPHHVLSLSVMSSTLAAGAAIILAAYIEPNTTETTFTQNIYQNAQVLPFAISAVVIFLLTMGYRVPVTHHMTITAGLAAVRFLPIVHENAIAALVIGVVFGVVAAFLAELANHLFYAHGDTHIDPPACAIWVSNTLVAFFTTVVFA